MLSTYYFNFIILKKNNYIFLRRNQSIVFQNVILKKSINIFLLLKNKLFSIYDNNY